MNINGITAAVNVLWNSYIVQNVTRGLKVKISIKQIMLLMEAGRILSIDKQYPRDFQEFYSDLIFTINNQQSEELIEIKND